MGEKTLEGDWCRRLEEAVREVEKRFSVEAVILFGSWSRGCGGEWSDVDILVVTDDVAEMNPLDRFTVSAELRRLGVDAFFYTFSELESMALKGNPLALSALIEGRALKSSSRVDALRGRVRNLYTRRGRVWVRTP